MLWRKPDSSQEFAAAFLLLTSLVLNLAGLAGASRYLIQYQNQEQKTSATYCETKLNAIGYKSPSNQSSSENQEEQKRRLDICLQTRSAEAAEDASKYTRRQYWFSVAGFVLVFVATVSAGAAAIFTYQQASIARDTARRQLRAYLGPVSARVVGLNRVGNPIAVRVTIKNVGATPAALVKCIVNIHVHEYPWPGIIIPSTERASPSSCFPGVEIAYTQRDIRLPAEIVDKVVSGEWAIYAAGTVDYRDIYGEQQHTTFILCFGGEYGINGEGEMHHYRDGAGSS